MADERPRSAAEYLSDNANNEAEKRRAGSGAAAVAQAGLDSPQAAVARAAKAAAEPELAAATKAHDDAPKAHNANMGTRATAKKIQATNTPNPQAGLDGAQAVANKVLAKQVQAPKQVPRGH